MKNLHTWDKVLLEREMALSRRGGGAPLELVSREKGGWGANFIGAPPSPKGNKFLVVVVVIFWLVLLLSFDVNLLMLSNI